MDLKRIILIWSENIQEFNMVHSIAFALDKFGRYAGGAESYALALAESFVKKGWEVHLFAQEWDGYPEQAIFHRIVVPKYLPAWLKMLVFAFKHRKMVLATGLDVVVGFGNTIYMNVYQTHGGVHRYSTARKCFSIENPLLRLLKRFFILLSMKDKMRNWIESSPFRLSLRPRIIAISQMVIDDFATAFKVPSSEVDLVYNGIDLDRFNPVVRRKYRGPLRAELDVGEREVLFLFLSYTLRKKGLFVLLSAAAILQRKHKGRFKVVVVGRKPGNRIMARVKKMNLDDIVIFPGPTTTPEVYFANADVFVLPTYYDTCSLVTIEAMACGVPAITTEYNGAAGIIDSGVDGHVIMHPPEAEELSAVMSVYLDSKTLDEMSFRAAGKAQAYSSKKNHEEVIRICSEVAMVKHDS
ncbi:MAG: glycosyltransferase family 4 protein [Proteobacteria bacterium]|nr:glycosyltransferase family 4 protein [Pseudomonadota bacterium]MBU1739803.1 glycosyltransferase family 4 protein [Pseudomonadota bacterium]